MKKAAERTDYYNMSSLQNKFQLPSPSVNFKQLVKKEFIKIIPKHGVLQGRWSKNNT